jgi:Mrp family chromosome partitioning ATPase
MLKKLHHLFSITKKRLPFIGKKFKRHSTEQTKDYLKTPSEFVEEQMIGLYRSLSALLPNKRHWGRSIQFIASRSGEGASVVGREFAKVLARRLDMSVLLVDADPQGEQLAHFGIQRSMGWNEAVFDNAPIQYALKQIDDSKLFVTQMAMPGESITRIVHAPEIEAILEDLKRQFDFIVIDTLPGTVSVDGLTLSHKVDGVILVVEAECTRWQIVQQTKENIEIRGGNVLGVILNKRRFYIPKFIYDRLL